jgi:hypothetical protein
MIKNPAPVPELLINPIFAAHTLAVAITDCTSNKNDPAKILAARIVTLLEEVNDLLIQAAKEETKPPPN